MAQTLVKPSLSKVKLSGLKNGKPNLSFKLSAGQNEGKIRSLSVKLPKGLSFIERHHKIKGVSISGAKIAKLSISHGKLTITLRSAATSVSVRAGVTAIDETPALARGVHRHKVKSLKLSVATSQSKVTTLTAKVAV